MKTILTIVFCLGTLSYSSFIRASAGWTEFVEVAELVPTARHYYEVRLTVKKNPSGCKNNTWFYQDYGLRGSDKMFTTLLEAVKLGKRVRVYVTGACNLEGYSEFSSVSIIP